MIVLLLIALAAASLLHIALDSGSERPVYRDPRLSSSLVRGSIFDRNGSYLAIQAPDYGFTVAINDSSASEIAAFIERFTDENAISIESKIDDGASFIPITMIPSPEESEEIRKMAAAAGLDDDIALSAIETRKYPLGSHAMDIVGVTDSRLRGLSGIERIADSTLSPVPSLHSVIATGGDVTLTIDSSLQYLLTSLLGEGTEAALIASDGSIAAYCGETDERTLESMIEGSGVHHAIPAGTDVGCGYTLSVISGDADSSTAEAVSRLIAESKAAF